jgi:hypothetical protein
LPRVEGQDRVAAIHLRGDAIEPLRLDEVAGAFELLGALEQRVDAREAFSERQRELAVEPPEAAGDLLQHLAPGAS